VVSPASVMLTGGFTMCGCSEGPDPSGGDGTRPIDGNGQADKGCQRQRVVVEVLWQPHLSHTGIVGGTRGQDDVVNHVGGPAVRRDDDSSCHPAATGEV
jgi:hypothetical protein